MRLLTIFICLLFSSFYFSCQRESNLQDGPRRIEILFLGHDSEHHPSAQYMPMLAAALSKEGINFTYTDKLLDLNPETLSWYDGLMIYANHDSISTSSETAILDFVAQGKAFLPVHCASFCFQNSEKYIDLVGGQFLKHDTATFIAQIINREHPTMEGLSEFSTWDETYVHHKLSDDRITLMERVDGDHHEPWTWVKEHGNGRVFYTAYGHDERTWNNPGFHQLMKQGIVWAVGDKVKDQWEEFRKTIPELVYKEAPNIPNYEKRDPVPQYQDPLSPEESKTLIQVPVGFDLELYASEPDIINPIAMDWDERGRLWVIETVDYPNTVRNEEGVGDDRIKICEDTDGDGKADKFTIFADKLNLPTSLAFANGGIIVSQAPYFLFLKDTDGDDKADVRDIIIEGWGTFDTHAGPSNLKYGLDNQIWGTVGYSSFEGTVGGKKYEFAQGLYRFTRDVSSFEFLTSTSNNTWGLGFTENNDVFGSTANNTHSVFMGISDQDAMGVEGVATGSIKIDGHYAMHPTTPKVRQVDVFGGFTAAAGHNFYTARAYPKSFWNNIAFVCEPTGHLVHMASIVEDGAGFVEKDGWNLFAGADEWVAPVEAKVGPDGAVWVLDWYNFIVQHNPTPTPDRGGYEAENGPGNAYQNPLRDKSHGRIWRVVYRDAKPYTPIQLSSDRADELVDALSNDNMFWRMTAQRLLVERNDMDVLPSLYKLITANETDLDGNNVSAIHALWTIHGLGAIESGEGHKVLTEALEHPSAGVRKAAIQILAQTELTEEVVLESNVLNDVNPNTRLAAIVSLVAVPPSEKIGSLLYAISKEESVTRDGWLSKAVYVASARHRKGFIDAFLDEYPDYSPPDRQVDQKRESANLDTKNWRTMALPQRMERAGLVIDGIVWFRTTIEISGAIAGKMASVSLGPINDSDETWINGVKVGATDRNITKKRVYGIPAGILKSGRNTIAVKVVDFGGSGGIYGKADEMFIQAGNEKISLAGDWKFDVEREFKAANSNAFETVSIADLFMNTYYSKPISDDSKVEEVVTGKVEVITIKVIQNEMKYDLTTFTVEAGKAIEIVLENPDFMQHNLVIGKQGSFKIIGAAADELASNPKAAEMNYVPDIPEVLFATTLVNPQQTVRIQFTAPSEPGDYPYVCTFPGHWSIMNGIMKVVESK